MRQRTRIEGVSPDQAGESAPIGTISIPFPLRLGRGTLRAGSVGDAPHLLPFCPSFAKLKRFGTRRSVRVSEIVRADNCIRRRKGTDDRVGRSRGNFEMAKQSLIRDFIGFIKHEKKWWLVPLLIILMLVGVLIVFAQSSPLAPFIYPFF